VLPPEHIKKNRKKDVFRAEKKWGKMWAGARHNNRLKKRSRHPSCTSSPRIKKKSEELCPLDHEQGKIGRVRPPFGSIARAAGRRFTKEEKRGLSSHSTLAPGAAGQHSSIDDTKEKKRKKRKNRPVNALRECLYYATPHRIEEGRFLISSQWARRSIKKGLLHRLESRTPPAHLCARAGLEGKETSVTFCYINWRTSIKPSYRPSRDASWEERRPSRPFIRSEEEGKRKKKRHSVRRNSYHSVETERGHRAGPTLCQRCRGERRRKVEGGKSRGHRVRREDEHQNTPKRHEWRPFPFLHRQRKTDSGESFDAERKEKRDPRRIDPL